MTTAKRWSYSTGERGRNRVRVFQDGTRPLLVEFYEGGPGSASHSVTETAGVQSNRPMTSPLAWVGVLGRMMAIRRSQRSLTITYAR